MIISNFCINYATEIGSRLYYLSAESIIKANLRFEITVFTQNQSSACNSVNYMTVITKKRSIEAYTFVPI